MIPGIVAGQASAYDPTPPVAQYIALPLTYDEADAAGALTWTRQGNGPHITPDGMVGDGVGSRYRANASLPAWVTTGSTGKLTLHASVRAVQGARNATRDTVAYVGTDDAGAQPKLEICVTTDQVDSTQTNISVASYTGSLQIKRIARASWTYGFRFPGLSSGGEKVRPQAVLFLDNDTLLVSGHYNDTLSRVYKVRLSDLAVLGSFDFASPHVHIGAAAYRASDGTYWFGDYATGDLLQVDIDASFTGGTAVIDLTCDCSAVSGFAAIEWINDAGSDYLLAAEYLTSGTPYLYVFPSSEITNGGTANVANRTKRFVVSQRAQGITFDSGKLFASMNRLTADGSATGKIQRYDILTAIASLADGGTLTAEATWAAPSQYPEDIDFHPVTGELWTMTEGLTAVVSDDGWLAAWHRSLSTDQAWNHVTAEYNGGGSVSIYMNNTLFETLAWTPSVTPAAISVGGPPQAAAGQSNGFFIGEVKNLVFQDQPMTDAEYQAAVDGDHEPSALTVYTVSLTNPGAESTTTGWTNETGSLANRASNPAPHSGASYFAGGANAQTIARQRVGIATATGLTTGEIDAATMWVRVNWWQAGFGGTDTDVCSMGIRLLDGTPTQTSLAYGDLLQMAPNLTWFRRGLSASIASGSRNIDAVYRSDRNNGTNNDGYVDDIEMVIYKQ